MGFAKKNTIEFNISLYHMMKNLASILADSGMYIEDQKLKAFF
jgi:hypothetical protein